MLKKILIFCFIIFLYSKGFSNVNTDKIINYLSSFNTLKSNFIQVNSNGDILTGKVLLARPGKFRVEYNEISVLIISDGRKVAVINKDIKNISFSDIKDIPGIFMDTKSSAIPENITKDLFKRTLEDLILSKEAEGKKIKSTFNSRINKINRSLIFLTKQLDKNKNKRKKNICTKLKVMDFDATNESISNEVVNQIIKSDISEEIDRLNFHITSLADELNSKNARGKKIDFILLEMLREANTILAKTTFSSEKKYGLIIKILIEEMREQVGNVE